MSYSVMELGPVDVYTYVCDMFGSKMADNLDGYDEDRIAYLAGKAFKEDVWSVPGVCELFNDEIRDALESEGVIERLSAKEDDD